MNNTSNFKMGWIPDLPNPRDVMFSASISTIKTLPTYIDMRENCPPVLQQGDLRSCTANASASAFQFDQQKQKVNQFSPSRLFIYYNTRKAMETIVEDSGASLRETVKSMNKLGVCAEDRWPYDISRFTDQPDTTFYDIGLTNQVIQYKRLDNNSLTQLKACLVEGYPFIFGFTVWESFLQARNNGIMPMPTPDEQILGGHAVMAVGYDDIRQVFIVRNSWGADWGDAGYFYMPYAFICDTGCADDFWTIRMVEEGLKTRRPIALSSASFNTVTDSNLLEWHNEYIQSVDSR